MKIRAKLRDLLWHAWASWRPIYGGATLYYTSLREQYVYKRAARLYNATYSLDPGKSGRTLAAWLRRGAAAPMDDERGVKRATSDVNAEATAEAAPKPAEAEDEVEEEAAEQPKEGEFAFSPEELEADNAAYAKLQRKLAQEMDIRLLENGLRDWSYEPQPEQPAQ